MLEMASICTRWGLRVSISISPKNIYYSVCTLNSICTKSIYSRICILEYKEYILQDLYTKLYPHQKEGLLWFWGLHKKRTGGILADDMG